MDDHADDRVFLEAMAEIGDAVEGDALSAQIDSRRFDTVRARRWLASAMRRGLVQREADRDHLGRVIGQFRFRITPAGARHLNDSVNGTDPRERPET